MIQTAERPVKRLSPAELWDVVMGFPKLQPEAKLGWYYLFFKVADGRVNVTVDVCAAAIGEKYGAADASRSGKRVLEALQDKELIRIVDGGPGGVFTVYLNGPVQARKARMLRSDPQRDLFEEYDDPDPIGGLAAVPPTSPARPPAPCKSTLTLTPNTSICARAENTQRHCGGETADEFAAGEAVKLRLAEVQQRVEEQPVEAEALVKMMLRRVDDPNQSEQFCRNVAWAIVEGVYPMVGLLRILSAAEVKLTAPERGRYFVGSIRKSFEDRGVPLERSR